MVMRVGSDMSENSLIVTPRLSCLRSLPDDLDVIFAVYSDEATVCSQSLGYQPEKPWDFAALSTREIKLK